MVRDGISAGRWMAGAECPGGLRRVAAIHIPRLAQEGSAATTITRDCSGSLTRGSSRRTSPFSTTPTTAGGWGNLPQGRGPRSCRRLAWGVASLLPQPPRPQPSQTELVQQDHERSGTLARVPRHVEEAMRGRLSARA